MKKVLTAFLLIVMVAGCIPVSISHYKREGLIGVENQTSDLILVPSGDAEFAKKYLETLSECDDNVAKILADVLSKHCLKEKTTKAAPALIPLLAAGGKLIFDIIMDQRAKKLKELEKAAQGNYSGTNIVLNSEFKNCDCAILTRYEVKGSKRLPGSIAIVAFKKLYTDSNDPIAFTMQPIFVKAFNSIVLTAGQKPEKTSGETTNKNGATVYPMDIAIGIALKTLIKDKNSIPAVITVGTGAVSVSNLKIGKTTEPNCTNRCQNQKSNINCINDCPISEIIPYPVAPQSIISISMSMTETGLLGIDFDQETAEIKAIKEAIGPAVSKSIQELLTEDDKK